MNTKKGKAPIKPELAAKRLLKGETKQRRGTYNYKEGTTEVTFSPRKLATEAEQALAALLVKTVTMQRAAQLLGVGLPTLSRAVRAWHHAHPEPQAKRATKVSEAS